MVDEAQGRWSLDSWRSRPALHQPRYEDEALVERALATVAARPPIVSRGEIDRLRGELAEAAMGRRFLLHGGDCAERFSDCTEPVLKHKLQVLLQMSMALTYGTRKAVTRIGRLAGQYAKPRTSDTEQVGDVTLPVYRGDLVNGYEPSPEVRRPDPNRIVEGYYHSTASLNYIRALIEGGFADLHYPERWNLDFIDASRNGADYRRIVDAITDAVCFMETIGATDAMERLRRIAFYTSHEALMLPYEQALTRLDEEGAYYNLGAHYLWLGYRTCARDGAHVEYLRGIANPIGVKVGPEMHPTEIIPLLDLLNPRYEPGRVTLITRFGEERVEKLLPPFIAAVSKTAHRVVWSCDPMHGNTEMLPDGRKTRRLSAIFRELELCFKIHGDRGSILGGVHFELTGEAVTECVGGGVAGARLCERYDTACDPRLNGLQALEMAFLIARLLR